jgi:uncharacterized membrane protein YeaQ/YmgE (transglycosylase-associated protein family)
MQLLWWMMIGLIVGWLAGKILKGDSYGPFMDIVMGIGGAVAGGLVMQSAGIGGFGGTITTTLVAMVGAVVLTLAAGFVNGKRVYARQL